MNGVGLVFATMVPCYVVYVFALRLEHKAQVLHLFPVRCSANFRR
jgi:hypothetical protein